VVKAPRQFPSWLSGADDLTAAAIVGRALSFVGECELPPSSNRGPLIDWWNARRGAPLGSYWCASFAAEMWVDCGAETAGVGRDPSCDLLMQWCVKTGRFSKEPAIGAFVFYGVPGDAKHVGIVTRTSPYLCTVEGNAAWGGAFNANGETVIARRVLPGSPNILGYGHVWPLAKGAPAAPAVSPAPTET